MYIENPMTKVVGFFVFEPYKEFKVIGENLNEPTCYVVKKLRLHFHKQPFHIFSLKKLRSFIHSSRGSATNSELNDFF